MIYLLLLFAVVAHAQEQIYTNQRIDYTVDLSDIQIGKPFEVTYTLPADVSRILDIDSNITALGDTDIDVDRISGNTLDLTVTSFGVTNYPMPSLLLTVLETNGATNQFFTPGFEIPVFSSIITNTNLDFKDIEPVYFVWNHLWTIIIAVSLLIIIAIILMSQLINPKPKKAKEIIIDPYDRAERKLTRLKAQSKLLTEESYKEFFVEMSESVREFLSATVVPLAMEIPTSEIITKMKNEKLPSDMQEIITGILRNSDRAKYAKQIFTQDRIDEVVDDAFTLVKQVKRKSEREQADEQLRKS